MPMSVGDIDRFEKLKMFMLIKNFDRLLGKSSAVSNPKNSVHTIVMDLTKK